MARIMLCDDSRTILSIFEKKLQTAGHAVVAKGKDGEEGLALYLKEKPDLLLLDITMPNRDGRECLQDILKAHPSAKVVMVSALQDASVAESCIKAGAKAFIAKDKLFKDEDFSKDVLSVIDGVLKAA